MSNLKNMYKCQIPKNLKIEAPQHLKLRKTNLIIEKLGAFEI